MENENIPEEILESGEIDPAPMEPLPQPAAQTTAVAVQRVPIQPGEVVVAPKITPAAPAAAPPPTVPGAPVATPSPVVPPAPVPLSPMQRVDQAMAAADAAGRLAEQSVAGASSGYAAGLEDVETNQEETEGPE